jgi:hypothetical protein
MCKLLHNLATFRIIQIEMAIPAHYYFSVLIHKKILYKKEWKRKLSGDEGARTPDLGIANAALSQLSYIPTIKNDFYIKSYRMGQSK